MKTEWDYTELAEAYLERPDYAPQVLEEIFSIANLKAGDRVCDIGAGVAHLTLPLAQRHFMVDAVEPNDAMRANGKKRTKDMTNVFWSEGTGEATGRPSGIYDFVSFGSSFNVCDRAKALVETHRLLKSGKWFTCMWNHRDLSDPIQHNIEEIIKKNIKGYSYGTRREDQSIIIANSGLFENVKPVEGKVIYNKPINTIIEAWRSHATLHRQAGNAFSDIIKEISNYLNNLKCDSINIPYTTHAWVARKKD